jgi:hypothetical protein
VRALKLELTVAELKAQVANLVEELAAAAEVRKELEVGLAALSQRYFASQITC